MVAEHVFVQNHLGFEVEQKPRLRLHSLENHGLKQGLPFTGEDFQGLGMLIQQNLASEVVLLGKNSL